MAFDQDSLDDQVGLHCSHVKRGKRGEAIACLLFYLVCTTLLAHAQGVGSSGEIKGTITDASGGALPKATIVVVDTQTGQRRQVATNAVG